MADQYRHRGAHVDVRGAEPGERERSGSPNGPLRHVGVAAGSHRVTMEPEAEHAVRVSSMLTVHWGLGAVSSTIGLVASSLCQFTHVDDGGQQLGGASVRCHGGHSGRK